MKGNAFVKSKRSVALEDVLAEARRQHVSESHLFLRSYYLLTCWPPGPDDLLKRTSYKLRGRVLGLKLASHVLAAFCSSSNCPLGLSTRTENNRDWVETGCVIIEIHSTFVRIARHMLIVESGV